MLFLYRPTMEWLIHFKNMIQGVQTNITKGTVITFRAFGVFLILYAFLLLLANPVRSSYESFIPHSLLFWSSSNGNSQAGGAVHFASHLVK